MLQTGKRDRIVSLDVLRGLVIVLMAIDHIREIFAITPFKPTDITQTDVGWFMTRWITHFCAPVFVFLAGTSAFLYGQKLENKQSLSVFLIKRGLWLILVEIAIVDWSWNFAWPPLLVL